MEKGRSLSGGVASVNGVSRNDVARNDVARVERRRNPGAARIDGRPGFRRRSTPGYRTPGYRTPGYHTPGYDTQLTFLYRR